MIRAHGEGGNDTAMKAKFVLWIVLSLIPVLLALNDIIWLKFFFRGGGPPILIFSFLAFVLAVPIFLSWLIYSLHTLVKKQLSIALLAITATIVSGTPIYWAVFLMGGPRLAIGRSLGRITPLNSYVVRSFVKDLKGPDIETRKFALAALAELGTESLRRGAKAAVPVIIELLKDRNTRLEAADALGAMGSDAKEASPALVEVLVDQDNATSIAVGAALRDIGPGAVPALIEALGDRPRMARAAFVLGQIGPAAKDAILALTKLLEHPNPDIHQNARKALKQISGEESPSYFVEWPPVMTIQAIPESAALVYAKISLAQAKAGKRAAAEMTSREAFLIAAGIYNEIDKDKAFESIAELQAKAGEVKRAVETASAIKNDYRKVRALLGIAKAQAKAGDQQGAQTTFGKAIETASSLKNKHFALAGIAEARAEARDVQGALNTSVLLPSNSMKAEVLAVIAEAQVKAGDLKGARETIRTSAQLAGSSRKSAIFTSIAEAQAKTGDMAGALESAIATSGLLIKVETADIQVAIQIVSTIRDSFQRAEALRAIALVQAKTGDRAGAKLTFEKAVESAVAMSDDDPIKLLTLKEIAEIQEKAGEPADAKETVRHLFQIAIAIKDQGLRVWWIEEFAVSQAKEGDVKGALKVAKTYWDDFEKLADGRIKGRGQTPLERIAVALVEAGDLVSARQIASGVKNDIEKFQIITGIAAAQAKAGDFEGSLKTATEIQPGTNFYDNVLRAIAETQVEAGDIEGALETAGAMITGRRPLARR